MSAWIPSPAQKSKNKKTHRTIVILGPVFFLRHPWVGRLSFYSVILGLAVSLFTLSSLGWPLGQSRGSPFSLLCHPWACFFLRHPWVGRLSFYSVILGLAVRPISRIPLSRHHEEGQSHDVVISAFSLPVTPRGTLVPKLMGLFTSSLLVFAKRVDFVRFFVDFRAIFGILRSIFIYTGAKMWYIRVIS